MVLFQVFLFDNLSISTCCEPLVYVAFIALLPLDAPPAVMLLAGLVMGVSMDALMGAVGLNTIATLFAAFVRGVVVKLFCKRDELRESGVPCAAWLGGRVFLKYLITLILLHHALFFALEALSWAHLWHTVLRIVASSAVSVVFTWLIARVFTAQITRRI